MSREWDAATYHRVSSPQERWSGAVVERLQLKGTETVLDAGCGTGRVTRSLLERCARVIAVDGSEAMTERAREELPPEVTVLCQDLQDLELPEPADAIFSNAVLHWVPDHERLFARLFAAARPGGRMSAQCGGAGNVARVRAAADAVGSRGDYAPHLGGWEGPWNFSTPEAAAERLEAAGFTGVETWLHDQPVQPEEPAEFIATAVLGNHLDRLPDELRERYLEDIVTELGDPVEIDYVRLNIVAERPA